MALTQRLDVTDENGVRVVRFRDRRLFDDAVVREAGDQLLSTVPRSGPVALVLNFAGVESIASLMLGKFLLLQRRVDSVGGQLRLCEMNNVVQGVFHSTNLDRLFAIDRDLNESLAAIRRTRG